MQNTFLKSLLIMLMSVAANATDTLSLEAFLTISQNKVTNGSFLTVSVTSMGGKGDVDYKLWLNGKSVPVDSLGQAVIVGNKLGTNRLTLVANTLKERAETRAQFSVIKHRLNGASLSSLAEIQKHGKANNAVSLHQQDPP